MLKAQARLLQWFYLGSHCNTFCSLFPQIALAIGVLTSNRRGGWCTSSKIGRGAVAGCHFWAAIAGDWGGGWVYTLADWTCWLPLLGAIAGLPLLAAIAGCHCWGWGGDVAGCHCWAAIAGCHCWG